MGKKKMALNIPASAEASPTSAAQVPAEEATDADIALAAEGGAVIGVAEDGTKFLVPRMKNVVETLVTAETIIVMIGVFNIYSYFLNLPNWYYVAVFAFWRLCYNVGLGVLLRLQSKDKWMTRVMAKAMANPREPWAVLVLNTVRSSMGSDYSIQAHIPAFNAWIAYRWLVNLVLANDFVCYTVMAFRLLVVPDTLGVLEVLQYLVGIALMAFNYWAKTDAHRVLGDYAWFWGDFFFMVQRELTFDGIFEVFPHPMYTVGYSFFYGAALISRSYLLLLISLIAHCMQMAFLVVVEEPHMELVYGAPDQAPKTPYWKHHARTTLYDPSIAFVVVYCAIAYATGAFSTSTAVIAQAVAWRLFHTLVLGYVLQQQRKRDFWLNWVRMVRTNATSVDAYLWWRRVYHLSFNMNILVFVVAAVRLHDHLPTADPLYSSRLLGGVMLIALNYWSSKGVFDTLGDFGWSYGDFFLERAEYHKAVAATSSSSSSSAAASGEGDAPNSQRTQLFYTGVYRYLNNPDCVIGFAALYGLSLIAWSYELLIIAALSQVGSFAFLHIVELPHMKALYNESLREEGGFLRGIKASIRPLTDSPAVQKALREIDDVKQKVADKVEREIGEVKQKVERVVKEVKGKVKKNKKE